MPSIPIQFKAIYGSEKELQGIHHTFAYENYSNLKPISKKRLGKNLDEFSKKWEIMT